MIHDYKQVTTIRDMTSLCSWLHLHCHRHHSGVHGCDFHLDTVGSVFVQDQEGARNLCADDGDLHVKMNFCWGGDSHCRAWRRLSCNQRTVMVCTICPPEGQRSSSKQALTKRPFQTSSFTQDHLTMIFQQGIFQTRSFKQDLENEELYTPMPHNAEWRLLLRSTETIVLLL